MSDSWFVIAPPSVPANSGTAILWDSTYSLHGGTPVLNTLGPFRHISGNPWKRAMVTIFVDQGVTFFARALGNGASSWRTYNGSGSGESVTASTYFEREVQLQGEDQQLYILAGGTAPTTWEISIRLRGEPALGQ